MRASRAWRKEFLKAGLGVAALTAASAAHVQAQTAWSPEKAVEIVVQSSAGSGVDRTARMIQKIMQDGAMVPTPIVVVNKPGGAGNIAYNYLSQFAGDGHYLATATATLLTNHVLGLSALNYSDFTAVSVLYGEYIGFAVNAEGQIKTGRDLVERVKRNPESVAFAFGTSRGNANHIGIALAMKAAGIDPRRLKVVLYKASIDATTALMGGHVDVVATPTSTYASVMASGKVRIVAVAAPQRIAGKFSDVPTWREQGLDVVAPSYRMIIAPRGLNPGQVAFWDGVLGRLSQSAAWKKELEANSWENIYLPSAESTKYLAARYVQYRGVLAELGLAK
ncbi:MAG: tripartite tricarboxylate transporter substrate binding protein [Betaproteobacteria bacterium]|nr:tripartite tricarboxylate transporter substrate binding protein [Betaproteobacteria bacterium]